MTSKELFNKIRNYCKSPWVSTKERLPEVGQTVLIAYYTGEKVSKERIRKVPAPGYALSLACLYQSTPETRYISYGEITDPRHLYTTDNQEEKKFTWILVGNKGSIDGFQNENSPDAKFYDFTPEEKNDPNTKIMLTLSGRSHASDVQQYYYNPDFWMPIPNIR